jgi:nicotinamidase-related amidase
MATTTTSSASTNNAGAATNPGTALLIMDVQTNIIGRIGDAGKALTATLSTAINAARTAGIPVIYVVVGFRKGLPEISSGNKSFGPLKQGAGNFPGLEEPIAIDPSVAPLPGEVVVTKRRVSAFTGSDLEVVLRAAKVHHLVLAGISTSGVVLSTLREAADKDYQLSVLSDGCADPDAEVHSVLLEKVYPRQADVLTAAQWIAGIAAV